MGASRTRTLLYRLAGVRIGKGSLILGKLRLWGRQALTIGDNTHINTPCAICLDESVTIGSNVGIAHDVVLTTASHEIGPMERRCGALVHSPIVIEDGVWIGCNTTVLPGVTIGAGSIVSAGSLVTRSVPPNSLVGGMPARLIQKLEE